MERERVRDYQTPIYSLTFVVVA